MMAQHYYDSVQGINKLDCTRDHINIFLSMKLLIWAKWLDGNSNFLKKNFISLVLLAFLCSIVCCHLLHNLNRWTREIFVNKVVYPDIACPFKRWAWLKITPTSAKREPVTRIGILITILSMEKINNPDWLFFAGVFNVQWIFTIWCPDFVFTLKLISVCYFYKVGGIAAGMGLWFFLGGWRFFIGLIACDINVNGTCFSDQPV